MKVKAATFYNTSVCTKTASSKKLRSYQVISCSLKQAVLYMWLKGTAMQII